MADKTIQQRVWDHIESCLDVNGSWREMFNSFGILATLDLDLLLEDIWTFEEIAEEMSIPHKAFLDATEAYIYKHRLWTADMIVAHTSEAIRWAQEGADDESIVRALVDFAEREKRPDVIVTLSEVAADWEDEGLLEALTEELKESA
jgi:hypothetical protein